MALNYFPQVWHNKKALWPSKEKATKIKNGKRTALELT
jgi:hypothetical protein